MSWSDDGSPAMTSVSAILYNNELDIWVNTGTLSLRLVERTTPRRPKRNRKRAETAYANRPARRIARKKIRIFRDAFDIETVFD